MTTKRKIAVAIADDHTMFRKGLRALLEDFSFVGQVYEAGNGQELLDLLGKANPIPEVILLDMQMPVMDGLEATERVKAQYPDLKILILSMQDDENFILHMIEKGINGYLLKNAEPDELEKALLTIQTKDFYFNENLSQITLRALMGKTKKLTPAFKKGDFSDRELSILGLICREYTTAEIADMLNISHRTVEGHRNTLLEKTGSRNVAGLVVFAIKNGIIQI